MISRPVPTSELGYIGADSTRGVKLVYIDVGLIFWRDLVEIEVDFAQIAVICANFRASRYGDWARK